MRMDTTAEEITLQSVDNIWGMAMFNEWEEAELWKSAAVVEKTAPAPDQGGHGAAPALSAAAP